MQDRYVGDIGDFGKYGLLKALCQGDEDEMPHLSLGVVWYLFPDEQIKKEKIKNEKIKNDGKFINYLKLEKDDRNPYRRCDPILYDGLAQIVNNDPIVNNDLRNVKSIRQFKILPEGTVFYEEPLSFDVMPSIGPNARDMRLEHRSKWVQGGLEATRDCDVIFLDPDNGLQIESVQRYRKYGPKYVFYDELKPYWERGQSLVIYQHMNYSMLTDEQIYEWLSKIDEYLGGIRNSIFALRYCRGTTRAFIVIPSKAHEKILNNRAERFLRGPWKKHFEGPPDSLIYRLAGHLYK